MKKLLMLLALLMVNQAFAQGVWGTIPSTSSSTNVIVHTYKSQSSYFVKNWDTREVNIYITISEDGKEICQVKNPPALLKLDGPSKQFKCSNKRLTLSLYKGTMGGTWVTIELGNNGDDNNLLDTESELKNLVWKPFNKSSSEKKYEPVGLTEKM